MNRVAASTFCLTATLLGATVLLFPAWWESPAFDRSGMPALLEGGLWLASAAIMGQMWAGRPLRPSVALLGLAAYAMPTALNGMSIVWFTLEENNVAAIGSAIMWLGLAYAAVYWAMIVMSLVDDPVEMGEGDHDD